MTGRIQARATLRLITRVLIKSKFQPWPALATTPNRDYRSHSLKSIGADLTGYLATLEGNLIALWANITKLIVAAAFAESFATFQALVNDSTFLLATAGWTLWIGRHTITSVVFCKSDTWFSYRR